MEKNKILTKLNLKIKDYNNEFEKILENKLFSYSVKNLLLSMLYKMENAYSDYKTTKVEVPSKDEYIENIFRIIREKCIKILLVKSDTKEAEELEQNNITYKIDKENGEIVCVQNELTLLIAILELDGTNERYYNVPYSYLAKPLGQFIKEGKIDSWIEAIRDFNGWSWDIDKNKIKNLYSNFVYQNLILLNGQNKIIDIHSPLYETSIIVAVRQYISDNKDKEFISELKRIKKTKEERLQLFNDKAKFLDSITEEKKNYTKEIEKIDKLLNDHEMLKNEYYSRNKKLPNNEKIFSVSVFVKILEKERKSYLEKIDMNNEIISPKSFVKEKTKLEKEVEFLNLIFKKNTEKTMIDISKIFLDTIKQRISYINEENEEELIKYIYKLRYYRYIPINNEKYIKDIEELNDYFAELIKLIIKKAQKLKIWDDFSEDEEFTYQVLKEVFDTKIINLENINILIKTQSESTIVEYYDDTIIENSVELDKTNLKTKKKVKLFI